MATRLALFDLDGTLIDSEVGIVTSTEYALQKLGVPIPPREVLRTWIGPPLRATFPLAVGDDPEVIERAVALYRERFTEVGWREHTVYAGIAEAIETIASRGITLAVVTSKPDLYAGRIVASLPFGTHFSRVFAVSAHSAHCEKADLVAQALRHFGIAADETAMVGDRHFDMHGARANGVCAVGVSWGFGSHVELLEAGADVIAAQPAQLVDAVFATQAA